MVEDRTTRIDRFHENTGDKSFFNGHYYSDKAPGASFLAAPVYGVYFVWLKAKLGESRAGMTGLYLSTLAASAFPSAVAAALFFVVATQLVEDRNKALFVTTAFGLGSLAFPYSTVLFGHQLSGALLFISFSLLVRERRRAQSLKLPWRHWPVVMSGLTAGYAAVTDYSAAVPLLIIGLYLVWVASNRGVIAPFAWGVLPPAVLLASYNWASFGSPIGIGYSHLISPEFVQAMGKGFMGITYPKPFVLFQSLFGFYRGLLPLCPVLAISTVGLRPMWSRSSLRPELTVCVGIVSFYLLFNMSYSVWDGGYSLGPRHLIPMLSFLALPMVFGLGRGWAFSGVLLLISIGSMLAGAALSPIVPSRYVNVPFDYLYSRLLTGRGFIQWNWGVALGFHSHSRSSLLPLLIFWLAAAILLFGSAVPAAKGESQASGPLRALR